MYLVSHHEEIIQSDRSLESRRGDSPRRIAFSGSDEERSKDRNSSSVGVDKPPSVLIRTTLGLRATVFALRTPSPSSESYPEHLAHQATPFQSAKSAEQAPLTSRSVERRGFAPPSHVLYVGLKNVMRIYADFNGIAGRGRDCGLILDGFGTLKDLSLHSIRLKEGLALTFWDASDETEDLEVDVIVHFHTEKNDG